jgi:AbiV family abortive infection protein
LAKKYPYTFTEEQLRHGCIRCIDNVKGLLKSASILLGHEDSQQYALGLYMYAVEEFGKAILLKKEIASKKSTYKISNLIFESHHVKLLEGFKKLPSVCRTISRGVKVSVANTYTKVMTIKIDSNREVSIMSGVTGKFFDTKNTSFKNDLVPKEACFYMDWDKRNGTSKYDIATDSVQLNKNIEHFRKALNKFKYV